MTLSIEWRRGVFDETILIVEEETLVRAVSTANAERLSTMLTTPGDLSAWAGDRPLQPEEHDPAVFGELVISRAETGQVMWIDPERFWDGIYNWFRSRGVDYDSVIVAA